jgi:Protein of unknown function (DUF3604)
MLLLLGAGCIRVPVAGTDTGTTPDVHVLVTSGFEDGHRPPPTGRAVQSASGLLVWAPPMLGGPWLVQAQVDTSWVDVGTVERGQVVVVAAYDDARLRLATADGSRSGPSFTAAAASLLLGPAVIQVEGAAVPPLAGWAGGPDLVPLMLGATLSAPLELQQSGDLPPLDLQLLVRFDDPVGAAHYLQPACKASDCWSSEPTAWGGPWTAGTYPVEQQLQLTAPATDGGQARLEVELVTTVEAATLVLAAEGMDLYAAGGRWAWGDLHSHSNWSFDGCEDSESACEPRGDLPAVDWVAEAEAQGLDFAALTDHAEPDLVYLDGLEGAGLDIWEGQGDAVAEGRLRQSEGASWVLPLIGYEWTATGYTTTGVTTGGHKTVVFSEAQPCESYRIAGKLLDDGVYTAEQGEAVYVQSGSAHVTQPASLWDAIDAASLRADCVATRWLSFYHHTAYELPQWVDWTQPYAAPSRESVVEMYSEHGSSECVDLDEETCAWRINDNSGYQLDGSVQAALAQGFQLGFVGGTDSHDARPGSIDDGAGPVAHWRDSDGDGEADTVIEQFAAGGLTGAWVARGPETPLDSDTFFDAMEARQTAATSGPRPTVVALAVDNAGGVHLPGAVLDSKLGPFELRLSLPDGDGVVVDRIDGAGLATTSAVDAFAETWDGASGEWTYLRLRYGEGDSDERVWLSPWFVDATADARVAPSPQPMKRSASTAR